jgi:hypothetical protein
MSLDAIGIVSKNPELSVKFYALLGVELRVKGGPDHYEGPTASGVRIMLDSVGLVKKLDPSWQGPTGSGVVLAFLQEHQGLSIPLTQKYCQPDLKVPKNPGMRVGDNAMHRWSTRMEITSIYSLRCSS